MVFVPARFAPDAIYEAVDAGIKTVICITEHIPAHEMLRVYTYVRPKGVTLIGPNCPGVLSPGKANVGIIPAEVFQAGLDRPRLALGHADLPDRQRAGAARARQLDDRRHRRRPGRRLELHRHPREVRGGPGDEVRRARRRDRRRRGGEGRARTSPSTCRSRSSPTSPASRRRPARRWVTPGAIISGSSGTAAGEEGSARGGRDQGRHDADRGRRARRRRGFLVRSERLAVAHTASTTPSPTKSAIAARFDTALARTPAASGPSGAARSRDRQRAPLRRGRAGGRA